MRDLRAEWQARERLYREACQKKLSHQMIRIPWTEKNSRELMSLRRLYGYAYELKSS